MSEMFTFCNTPPSTQSTLIPPLFVSRIWQLEMLTFSNPPYDSVPSLIAPWRLLSLQPVAVTSRQTVELVDLRQIASSPLSMSQSLMVTPEQESMSMPSLCGATWLSIVT
jgi:hypothetical protein